MVASAEQIAQNGRLVAEHSQFGDYLKTLREGRGVSQRELGRLCGIHETYFGQIERGTKPPPRRKNLELIGAALGLSREELFSLFDAAGRPRPAGSPNRVPFWTYVRQDPDLTDDQRATLVSVYEQFVRANRRPPT